MPTPFTPLPSPAAKPSQAGFTLLEMSMVICVLLVLVGSSFVVTGKVSEWRLGKDASEKLRTVYTAQRMFLADNPTVLPTAITRDQIIPYLPNRVTEMPVITPVKGTALTINVTAIPPYLLQNGTRYDPSGSTTDNVWDVGE